MIITSVLGSGAREQERVAETTSRMSSFANRVIE